MGDPSHSVRSENSHGASHPTHFSFLASFGKHLAVPAGSRPELRTAPPLHTHSMSRTANSPVTQHLYKEIRAVAVLIAAVAASCTTLPATGDFTVNDSGSQVAQFTKLYWLDNVRLLFQGPDGQTIEGVGGYRKPVNRLFVWNTENGQITQGARIGGGLCYSNGFVRYWRSEISGRKSLTKSEWFAGPFGHEKPISRDATNPDNFNWETCKPYSELPPRPEWTQGLAVRWLGAGNGLLILGPADSQKALRNWPIKYCPHGIESTCVETPLRRRESKGFNWVPFKKAYFVSGVYFEVVPKHPHGGYNRLPWPTGLPMPVWWLYPDGRTEQITLPPGPWLQTFVYPSRVGMLTIGQGPTRWEHSLYLIRGNRGKALLHGQFHTAAVSPNGCKIAVDHDSAPLKTNAHNNRHVTLKVIELCHGK